MHTPKSLCKSGPAPLPRVFGYRLDWKKMHLDLLLWLVLVAPYCHLSWINLRAWVSDWTSTTMALAAVSTRWRISWTNTLENPVLVSRRSATNLLTSMFASSDFPTLDFPSFGFTWQLFLWFYDFFLPVFIKGLPWLFSWMLRFY